MGRYARCNSPSTSMTTLSANSIGIALSFLRTFFRLEISHRPLTKERNSSPLSLSRHNESSSDVSVLDKAFSVRDTHSLSHLQRGDSRGVGHRDDDVWLESRLLEFLHGGVGEVLAHCHTCSVDADTIDGGIGSSKVDKLKDVGRESSGLADLTPDESVSSDDDSLSSLDVLPSRETAGLSNNALAGNEVVGSTSGSGSSGQSRRSDTVGVSESNQTETGEHTDTGVGSSAGLHEVTDSVEDILLVDTELAGSLKVVGEDVEKDLGVRVGVDVSVSVGVKVLSQRGGVDKVTILRSVRGFGGR